MTETPIQPWQDEDEYDGDPMGLYPDGQETAEAQLDEDQEWPDALESVQPSFKP